MTTLEEVRAIIELRREEAGYLRGRAQPEPQLHKRDTSAVEDIWSRYGLHSVAATLTY